MGESPLTGPVEEALEDRRSICSLAPMAAVAKEGVMAEVAMAAAMVAEVTEEVEVAARVVVATAVVRVAEAVLAVWKRTPLNRRSEDSLAKGK